MVASCFDRAVAKLRNSFRVNSSKRRIYNVNKMILMAFDKDDATIMISDADDCDMNAKVNSKYQKKLN